MSKDDAKNSGDSGNELQEMLDKVVENAHARLDMAADILRAAVSSIPPEELAKLLLAAAPEAAAESAPAPAAEGKEPAEAPAAAEEKPAS